MTLIRLQNRLIWKGGIQVDAWLMDWILFLFGFSLVVCDKDIGQQNF